MKAQSPNAERALFLLDEVQKKDQKFIQAGLTKSTVLKFIAQMYLEIIKLTTKSPNPLYVSVYDYFTNKYGLKKVAETKYIQMLESTRFYSSVLRINRFSKIMGLGHTYETNIVDFYFNCFKLLDTMGRGTLIASNVNELYNIPLVFE